MDSLFGLILMAALYFTIVEPMLDSWMERRDARKRRH